MAEVLLARGPGPENELTDPGPAVRRIMETLDGHLGLRAGALNLSLIIEENGHVTALSKLQRDSGSRREGSGGVSRNPRWECFGQRQLSTL